MILASGSQDATIRLWNIEPFTRSAILSEEGLASTTDELMDAFEASLVNLEDTEDGGRQISMKRHILTVKSASGRYNLFVSLYIAVFPDAVSPTTARGSFP